VSARPSRVRYRDSGKNRVGRWRKYSAATQCGNPELRRARVAELNAGGRWFSLAGSRTYCLWSRSFIICAGAINADAKSAATGVDDYRIYSGTQYNPTVGCLGFYEIPISAGGDSH
jgi:hypothetical protein